MTVPPKLLLPKMWLNGTSCSAAHSSWQKSSMPAKQRDKMEADKIGSFHCGQRIKPGTEID